MSVDATFLIHITGYQLTTGQSGYISDNKKVLHLVLSIFIYLFICSYFIINLYRFMEHKLQTRQGK